MRLLQLLGIFFCSWSTLHANADKSDFPIVQVDSRGNALSIWQMTIDNVREIHTASYSIDMETWNTPLCISTEGVDSTTPVLKMNASGAAVAMWLESISDVRTLKAARFDLTNGWSAPFTLSTPHQFVQDNFSVEINGEGDAFAVWHAYLPQTKEYGVFASTSTNAANWTAPIKMSSTAAQYVGQRARPVKLPPVLKNP